MHAVAHECVRPNTHDQDLRGQASACCKLGLLYHQQGKLEAAVGCFERFFELARSLGALLQCTVRWVNMHSVHACKPLTWCCVLCDAAGEPRLLDVARANLGIVRGALQLGLGDGGQ